MDSNYKIYSWLQGHQGIECLLIDEISNCEDIQNLIMWNVETLKELKLIAKKNQHGMSHKWILNYTETVMLCKNLKDLQVFWSPSIVLGRSSPQNIECLGVKKSLIDTTNTCNSIEYVRLNVPKRTSPTFSRFLVNLQNHFYSQKPKVKFLYYLEDCYEK